MFLLRASHESLVGLATSAEESLVNEDMLTLPASGSIVVPLSESTFLVGLLVIERMGLDGAAPDASLSDAEITPFSSSEMRCCRGAARPLAKACAMALRASLTNAQQLARNQLTRQLLGEVKGPLRALQTFSNMLVPRLPNGEPDKDMAEGIVLQGQRLQVSLLPRNTCQQLAALMSLLPDSLSLFPDSPHRAAFGILGSCFASATALHCQTQHGAPPAGKAPISGVQRCAFAAMLVRAVIEAPLLVPVQPQPWRGAACFSHVNALSYSCTRRRWCGTWRPPCTPTPP